MTRHRPTPGPLWLPAAVPLAGVLVLTGRLLPALSGRLRLVPPAGSRP